MSLLPDWTTVNKDVGLLLILSSIFGYSIASIIYLGKVVPKPVQILWKPLQDFFAYDLYTSKLYRLTIVFGVGLVSNIVAFVDRYLVDGLLNLVGLASMFAGDSLKYSTSGQSQFYLFTVLCGIGVLGMTLGWPVLSHLSLSISP